MALVIGAISGLAGKFAATTLGKFLTTNIFGRLLTSVALSALKVAIAGTPSSQDAGIRTQQTQTGGVTPASFILGRYASEGQLAAPPMSHGQEGKTPNAYLTYVIELGDIPGQQLEGLIVDGERSELGTQVHADYGTPLLGRFTDHAWVKYYDGTQTAADAMLLDKYGEDPDRPWTAQMIGTGICYAIVTFRFNREIFSGFPKVRFELIGIPLYDPRKDTTVGGAGNHRWADRATWEPSENVGVLVYNIMRGIDLGGGNVWGGAAEAEDLPLASWWAAMNQADFSVVLDGGGTEPQWRASYEVFVSDEPAKVMEDMLRGCSGQVVENGGIWKIRLGGPGLPVYYFTDDDVILSEPEENTPYSAARVPFNGVQAVYPDPAMLWEPKDAPALYNATYEAEDGGQRRVADLSLTATPYPIQVQRVMHGYAGDERRLRQHVMHLPQDASMIEPLDVAAWTSEANGYVTKSWDCGSQVDPLTSGTPQFRFREVDQNDYNWTPSFALPVRYANINRTPLAEQPVAGFDLEAVAVPDADGNPRAPAVLITWDGIDQDDVRGILWEIRQTGSETILKPGSTADVTAGSQLVSEGILPNTSYEARGQWIVDRPTKWTDWAEATTDDIRLGEEDLSDQLWKLLGENDQAVFEQGRTLIDRAKDELASVGIDQVSTRIKERARVDGVIKQTKEQLTVALDEVKADITEIRTAAVTDAEALARLELDLTAEIGTANASLGIVATALGTLEQSFGQYQVSVSSEFDDFDGYIAANFYTKTDSDIQITSAIQTVNSNVADNYATITSVASAQNARDAVWAIDVDNNGVVNGIALTSTLLNGGVTSSFLVKADEFRVGQDGGPIGYTAPFQVINGVTYMTDAYIRNASITTLKIGENQVMVPVSSTRDDVITGNNDWQIVQSTFVALSVASPILVVFSGVHSYTGVNLGTGYLHEFRLRVGGQVRQIRGGLAVQDYPVLSYTETQSAGLVEIRVDWKAGPSLSLGNRTLASFGVKR